MLNISCRRRRRPYRLVVPRYGSILLFRERHWELFFYYFLPEICFLFYFIFKVDGNGMREVGLAYGRLTC